MPTIPKQLKTVLIWGCVLGGLFIFFRFLLPFVLPFLIGAGLAALMEPAVKALQKRFQCPRSVGAGILIGLGVLILLGLSFLLVGRIVKEMTGILERIPEWMSRLPEVSSRWEERITVWIEAAPVSLQEPLRQSLHQVLSGGISIPSSVYTSLAGWISGIATSLPSMVLFLCAVVFSAFLISADYPRLTAALLRPFSQSRRERIFIIKSRVFKTLGKWLKAQGMLMCLTFIQLCIGFVVLRMDAILLPAALIALIDALPVLGAGICLVPFAIYSFAAGDTYRAIGLLILYAVVMLVRSFTEPKLIGSQIGMRVLPTFAAMYIGFKAFGVLGMIVFPLLAVTGKQVWDSFRTAEEEKKAEN